LPAASCALRDTFLGHPVSVYPGPAKILSHRAQVRSGLRPTLRPAEPAATRTPARGHGLKPSPSTPRPGRRLPVSAGGGNAADLRDAVHGDRSCGKQNLLEHA
jgi:hypothetical protein